MGSPGVTRWHIGMPDNLDVGEGIVAFTAGELAAVSGRTRHAMGLHEAMHDGAPQAPSVDIHVPAYRGKAFINVLAWLAARLGEPEADVSWYVERRQGPASIRRALERAGWTLAKDRRGGTVGLRGTAPATVVSPRPRTFAAELGDARVTLAADYGVFSPERIDDGTRLLLDIALRHPPVDRVADIGIGYGALAIGLIRNGIARSAVATDVDCTALWLAGLNARHNDVSIELACTADPTAVQPTPLTVSNVPTHIDSEETAEFMARLANRAKQGRLLAVVHASLQDRYTRHLRAAGLRVTPYVGTAHVVLDAGRSDA